MSTTPDPFDLARFVQAQDTVMAEVQRELRQGRKYGHWMWFVFPQLRELGRSATARHYGISSLAEARAYAAHPLLGQRLVDCTALVLAVPDRTVHAIFGSPDDLKFRSCMTLFAAAWPEQPVFAEALRRHFGGAADSLTLDLLASAG
ncbi:DUF1810 domain-containing protein [Falsiroseomonas sp.]|uniref:DUF1810 domain-containing protein n=1 Tax=Falsiroseomonas sp. TaxID=2870721 RepID=UPI00271E54D0|nr:DUF1810 domain-containing protein [Falsiroseomonas sp.]MDO9500177.1 DUF1810 domain-containing protein [Falsiroseomonas sp.]